MNKFINTFKAGTIFNPLNKKIDDPKPIFHHIVLEFPYRLNAMSLDPSKIALNKEMKYTAGQITFSINICKRISVEILSNKKSIEITNRTKRKTLIKHICKIMKYAIGFKEGLLIDIDNENELKHIGFGTTGALFGGVASAINELYGNKLTREELLHYLSQNYGEEVEGSNNCLAPVQSTGGSIASGLWEGSILIISGENEVVKTSNLNGYEVIIGVPKKLNMISSEKALLEEVRCMKNFIKCGKTHGPSIAYQVLHRVLPAMNKNNLKAIGDVIYDYRFNMGSIKNCSFLYPELEEITKRLAYLKNKDFAEVLSISSVGPLIFAITKRKKECIEAFQKENLKVETTTLRNKSYSILEIK